LLKRLYGLLPEQPVTDAIPPPETSTHLLHLAPHGQILPHVDNVDASGSVIIGLSLGAERILRLESEGQGWEVLLKSGSVYRQK
jgi:alkylated DNA repair protein alkB family protein 7